MCFRFFNGESDIFPSICGQFCISHYACADIDRTVALASIELRDLVRNALGLAYNIITIKELEEWFCNEIHIILSPFVNNTVIDALSNLSGDSFHSFDLFIIIYSFIRFNIKIIDINTVSINWI